MARKLKPDESVHSATVVAPVAGGDSARRAEESEAPSTAATFRQLWLFTPPRAPLARRVGDGVFRAAPAAPGVYLMWGGGRVIYVGMSGNLRRRLASYRLVRPGRESRKTLRLVHAAERIEWELCDSVTSAALRENALIREHRPRFNRIGIWPEAHGFIGVRRDASGIALCVSPQPREGWVMFGAFKAGRRRAVETLNQLLAWTTGPDRPVSLLPASRALRGDHAPAAHPLPAPAVELLIRFLGGADAAFLEWLREALALERSASRFDEQLKLAGIEELGAFFANGPMRINSLRAVDSTMPALIPPLELDDWLVRARHHQAAAGEGAEVGASSGSACGSFCPEKST